MKNPRATTEPRTTRRSQRVKLDDDPLWYKEAILYELHVRAFHDSNGDGIGDFRGLVQKLDYLQDLGITAIWLLPFYPSPLRDDGYDIAHYTSVNPAYGTLGDFKEFLRESHRRGMRVITELVVNHTSSEHPWFQRARRSPPGSKERDFYVWSDTPDRYQDARIIFQDFESSNWAWDPVAKAYYWHRFYSHQPDLNFDNPRVRRALLRVLDFWMGLGVDGMRLDAVPYLFEREGTNCENLPETHAFLKELRAHIDQRWANRMLLAEANQWPSDAAAYFGNGDECHMNFHFPLMPRMFMAVQLEDRFPIQDILRQTPPIAENCQWATFLRNHDELTLEMVTDEDRDYMWRVYAEDSQARINLGIRRRLHPLLKTRRKVELMNALLFSLPGTPVLYYGDEIGMGDNMYLGDRNGVRTPFQWSADRNAGFSRANPQKLYLPVIIDPEYHYEAVNVETHQANPTSLLWWTKRLIAACKDHPALTRGTIDILHPANKKVLCFVRAYGDERLLVVANLSRYSQAVELDLRAFQGCIPEELFGRSRFPVIGEAPYLLTLTPHGFYWLLLRPAETVDREDGAELRRIEVGASWRELLGERRGELEELLLTYVPRQRWFRSKTRQARGATVVDWIEVTKDAAASAILVVRMDFYEGEEELYLVPLAASFDDQAKGVLERSPGWALAHLSLLSGETTGLLHDAALDPAFGMALLSAIARGRSLRGERGQLAGWARPGAIEKSLDPAELAPRPGSAEQSNTSLLFDKRYILKLVRRLDAGKNPDVEVTDFLNRKGFEHVPLLAGTLEYSGGGSTAACAGILQRFVPGRGDGWQLTLDMLDRYFEEALAREGGGTEPPPAPSATLVAAARAGLPEPARELLGTYLPLVRLLGQRTGEMHLALAAAGADPAFAPERFSELHQRSLYQSARMRLTTTLELLRKSFGGLPDDLARRARALVEREDEVDRHLGAIVRRKLVAKRIRCHGDYHLGQVLYTGADFVILDFEGEPARSLNERRFKRSPLRDIGGMLRSFHYAARAALDARRVSDDQRARLLPWAERWAAWASIAYLEAWLEEADDAGFLPAEPRDQDVMLGFYLMEKCVYELGYELNNRPAWIGVPIAGMETLLGDERSATT